MKYLIKPHARQRMRERGITEAVVREALERPTKIGYDTKGRMRVKKLYRRRGKEYLLLIVGELIADAFEIITLIETSKLKKYL